MEPRQNVPTAQLQAFHTEAVGLVSTYCSVESGVEKEGGGAVFTSPNSPHSTNPCTSADAREERILDTRFPVESIPILTFDGLCGIEETDIDGFTAGGVLGAAGDEIGVLGWWWWWWWRVGGADSVPLGACEGFVVGGWGAWGRLSGVVCHTEWCLWYGGLMGVREVICGMGNVYELIRGDLLEVE